MLNICDLEYKLKSINPKILAGMQQGSKIWGGHIVLGGDNVLPLVEIGLTDLPKSGGGGARAPPAPRLQRAWNVSR